MPGNRGQGVTHVKYDKGHAMAYIETIAVPDATGPLKKLYDAAEKRAGKVFNIVKLMSQNPATAAASMQLYTTIMHRESPLTRAQREMIATVVSRENNCFY